MNVPILLSAVARTEYEHVHVEPGWRCHDEMAR